MSSRVEYQNICTDVSRKPWCVMSPDAEGVDKQNDVYIQSILRQLKLNNYFNRLSSYTSGIAYRVTLANEISSFDSFDADFALPLSLCVISLPYYAKA